MANTSQSTFPNANASAAENILKSGRTDAKTREAAVSTPSHIVADAISEAAKNIKDTTVENIIEPESEHTNTLIAAIVQSFAHCSAQNVKNPA